MYIHERDAWTHFRWDEKSTSGALAALRHRQGRFVGRMEALGFHLRGEAVLQTLTEDVIKSSEIEGEALDRADVRSSIARRLGLESGAISRADYDVEGVVEMTLDATQSYHTPLTIDRLLGWQAALFPSGRSGLRKIRVGAWRDDAQGPMQVVSGPLGRERVHFQAPPAPRVQAEVVAFLSWFDGDAQIDPVLKACIAHVWFVTIHPFEDGNGRIARAIADMALARSEGTNQRCYSMSAQIRAERGAYYRALEEAQGGDLDVTPWVTWFLGCLDRGLDRAEVTLSVVMRKARLWDLHDPSSFNERQRSLMNRLIDGFDGKLTSSKWAKITKCSQETALRDIDDLVRRGVLTKDLGGGRSTSYSLAIS